VEGADLVAAGTCHFSPDRNDCEFTILVTDAWQGKGLADCLMDAILDIARRRGIGRIFGHTLATNVRMLKFARRHGFSVTSESHRGAIRGVSRVVAGTGGAGDASTRSNEVFPTLDPAPAAV
jgi:GNAT superfamily N-acetyltransferase